MHYRRQAGWLKDSYLWLLEEKVLGKTTLHRPRVLDVGCGPGYVMDILRGLADIEGVDSDPDMVRACRARGLSVKEGRVERLPFGDGEFDIVYCSFLLMWLSDPGKALQEMRRVSREWVVCLAEPDMGGRIDNPQVLGDLRYILALGLRDRGADPYIGRRLGMLFRGAGMEAETGVHGGSIWDIQRLRQETEDEWAFIGMSAPQGSESRLDKLREYWDRALDEGTLFQFNPYFWVVGKANR